MNVIREQSAQALSAFSTAHHLDGHYKSLNQNFGRTLVAAKEIASCAGNSTKPCLHAGNMIFGMQNVE